MVALGPRQAEQPLLQDRVAPVPQREREAEAAFPIADAEQSVLAPAIGPAARVVVREVLPAGARLGVVLAYGAPLTLGQIGPEALPVPLPVLVFRETDVLGSRAHQTPPSFSASTTRSRRRASPRDHA